MVVSGLRYVLSLDFATYSYVPSRHLWQLDTPLLKSTLKCIGWLAYWSVYWYMVAAHDFCAEIAWVSEQRCNCIPNSVPYHIL